MPKPPEKVHVTQSSYECDKFRRNLHHWHRARGVCRQHGSTRPRTIGWPVQSWRARSAGRDPGQYGREWSWHGLQARSEPHLSRAALTMGSLTGTGMPNREPTLSAPSAPALEANAGMSREAGRRWAAELNVFHLHGINWF